MSTAPCPDPHEGNEELFKAVDGIFKSTSSFLDEDGNEREFGSIDSDVIEKEVARFAARLQAAPSGVSPHEEG